MSKGSIVWSLHTKHDSRAPLAVDPRLRGARSKGRSGRWSGCGGCVSINPRARSAVARCGVAYSRGIFASFIRAERNVDHDSKTPGCYFMLCVVAAGVVLFFALAIAHR